MKRWTVAGSTLTALVLAIAVPSTVLAAGPFSYTVLRDVCRGEDRPVTLTLKVKVREVGMSGANYFRVRTTAIESWNGSWHTVKDWGWEYSNSFPNDADNWYHVRAHTWEMNGDHDAAKLRMKVQVWSNTQGMLSQKVITGDLCQAYL